MIGIKIALRKANITQADLALRLNVSTTTVSSWVTGKHEPSIKTVKEISKITGVPVGKIIKDY